MKYNELTVTANTSKKRVGRGTSSGKGKTAGRGTKGQGSRSGKNKRPLLTTGGTGHIRQLPKSRGFKSKRAPAQVVYADQLDSLKDDIDNLALFKAGLIATPYQTVKIIARNDFKSKANVNVAGMSESVRKMLESNGGKFTKTPVPLPSSLNLD